MSKSIQTQSDFTVPSPSFAVPTPPLPSTSFGSYEVTPTYEVTTYEVPPTLPATYEVPSTIPFTLPSTLPSLSAFHSNTGPAGSTGKGIYIYQH